MKISRKAEAKDVYRYPVFWGLLQLAMCCFGPYKSTCTQKCRTHPHAQQWEPHIHRTNPVLHEQALAFLLNVLHAQVAMMHLCTEHCFNPPAHLLQGLGNHSTPSDHPLLRTHRVGAAKVLRGGHKLPTEVHLSALMLIEAEFRVQKLGL